MGEGMRWDAVGGEGRGETIEGTSGRGTRGGERGDEDGGQRGGGGGGKGGRGGGRAADRKLFMRGSPAPTQVQQMTSAAMSSSRSVARFSCLYLAGTFF
jgi:hypothetical protein